MGDFALETELFETIVGDTTFYFIVMLISGSLSIKDMELRERFRDYKQELAKKTAEKAEKLKTNYDLL